MNFVVPKFTMQILLLAREGDVATVLEEKL